jgi:hypothetical protein
MPKHGICRLQFKDQILRIVLSKKDIAYHVAHEGDVETDASSFYSINGYIKLLRPMNWQLTPMRNHKVHRSRE